MEKEQEGFCESCAKKQREAADAVAKLCGHPSHVTDACLCVTCAVRLGLCRGCGMSLVQKQKAP
ncbi:MAG TPA: hypothetical protein VL426_05065 [Candidatus Binatia bacterium]|nr:hypothetical protein [Candidatus Binatia bacterium]